MGGKRAECGTHIHLSSLQTVRKARPSPGWPGDRCSDFANAVFPQVILYPTFHAIFKKQQKSFNIASGATNIALAPFKKVGFK